MNKLGLGGGVDSALSAAKAFGAFWSLAVQERKTKKHTRTYIQAASQHPPLCLRSAIDWIVGDSVLRRLERWLGGVLDGLMYLKMGGIGVQNEAWRDRKSLKKVLVGSGIEEHGGLVWS